MRFRFNGINNAEYYFLFFQVELIRIASRKVIVNFIAASSLDYSASIFLSILSILHLRTLSDTIQGLISRLTREKTARENLCFRLDLYFCFPSWHIWLSSRLFTLFACLSKVVRVSAAAIRAPPLLRAQLDWLLVDITRVPLSLLSPFPETARITINALLYIYYLRRIR